jgi:hypothetical protein
MKSKKFSLPGWERVRERVTIKKIPPSPLSPSHQERGIFLHNL